MLARARGVPKGREVRRKNEAARQITLHGKGGSQRGRWTASVLGVR